MLQGEYFEEIGGDDWFTVYSEAYQVLIERTYDLLLSKKEEKGVIDALLFETLNKEVKALQKKLVGEVIC